MLDMLCVKTTTTHSWITKQHIIVPRLTRVVVKVATNEFDVSQLQTEKPFHWQDLPSQHCSKHVTEKHPKIFSSVQLLFTLPCINFPSNPNSALLPRQQSRALEHHLGLQRTARGVIEETRLVLQQLGCSVEEHQNTPILHKFTQRDRHLHKYTERGCILSYTGRTSEPGRVYHLKNEYSQAHHLCKLAAESLSLYRGTHMSCPDRLRCGRQGPNTCQAVTSSQHTITTCLPRNPLLHCNHLL